MQIITVPYVILCSYNNKANPYTGAGFVRIAFLML